MPTGCVEHTELLSAERWAVELGRSESWVVQNHRISLWSQPSSTGSKGLKVGEMRPGSRAVVVDYDRGDFLVKSPLDDSIGWIGEIQIGRRLSQDTRTREACP